MYHSITFSYFSTKANKIVEKNTWVHWHLIPSARPVVSQPSPTYKFVDIPGMDGSLDLSSYLIGRPTYSDRSGSFKFYVNNDYKNPDAGWASRKKQIASFLNGKIEMKMVLEDDPKYYYVGRFYMREWTPGTSNSEVTIEYRVRPYKYELNGEGAVLG